MVLVARPQSGKCLWIAANNHGVHALGDRHLPGIVFTHALISPALTYGRTLTALTPDGLPAKSAKFTQKPTPACYKNAADHQATSYHRIIGLLQMRRCLAEGYPFVFGFSVYTAFESAAVAKTGKLNLPKPGEKNLGGHAVCAVGYDDAAKRVLVRNSWGTDWGMNGYFTIPYDYVSNDNLADDFWTLRAFENE